MSTSISRGPWRKLGVRPTLLSTSRSARSSRTADPSQAMTATAFQKSA
jgi:hypothetical protein